MNIETTNFDNFTADEYLDNLLRLGVTSHTSLIDKKVYYVTPKYGLHTIVGWDENKAEFLLDLDGQKFWSNPFKIHLSTEYPPQKICLANRDFSNCHIHSDNLDGCLGCGNFQLE
jgi:hypothetical protein